MQKTTFNNNKLSIKQNYIYAANLANLDKQNGLFSQLQIKLDMLFYYN